MNRTTRIRDQERAPVAADLKRAMREKSKTGQKTFALSADVSDTYRRVRLVPPGVSNPTWRYRLREQGWNVRGRISELLLVPGFVGNRPSRTVPGGTRLTHLAHARGRRLSVGSQRAVLQSCFGHFLLAPPSTCHCPGRRQEETQSPGLGLQPTRDFGEAGRVADEVGPRSCRFDSERVSERQRQTETERDRERRQRQRETERERDKTRQEDKREDKTRKEKTRQNKRRNEKMKEERREKTREDERGEKRHVKMKEKVKDKRREDREKTRRDKKKEKRRDAMKKREKMKEKMKREMKRGEKIFQKNVSRPSNPPDELAQNVSKKSLSDELFLHFFCKSSESGRFSFIYMIRIRFFGPGELIQNYFRRARYWCV